MRSTTRHGSTMIAVETAPAEIDFADILEATRAEVDPDETEAPWNVCEGWEHGTVPPALYGKEDLHAMRSFVAGGLPRPGLIIELPADEDYGIFEHLRKQGATKQVAREAVAAARRKTLDQLVEWYSDGWDWWAVVCEFTVLGKSYCDSLSMIDSHDYAEEQREEIALEVAHQLEADGYTVTNKPEGEPGLSAQHFGTVVSTDGIRETSFRRIMTCAGWRETWQHNMAAQNWSAD